MTINVLVPTLTQGKIAFPATRGSTESDEAFTLRATREALDWVEKNQLGIDRAEKIEYEEVP